MPSLPVDLRDLLAAFAAGPAVLRGAVRGLTPAELVARPTPSAWTVRDNLVHLCDSELVLAVNVRLALAEDGAPAVVHDPERWQRRLHYVWRSPEAALAAFEQARFGTADLLARFDTEGWGRAVSSPAGPITVRSFVEAAAAHLHDHMTAIAAVRPARAGRSAAR